MVTSNYLNNKKISIKTLNILFFCFIILCSLTTTLSKSKIKSLNKISKKAEMNSNENNEQFPDLTTFNLPNVTNLNGKS